MEIISKGRREHLAAWCNAISGGAFVGGVMFNVLGAGNDTQNAGIGLALVVLFLIFGYLLKGGKNG